MALAGPFEPPPPAPPAPPVDSSAAGGPVDGGSDPGGAAPLAPGSGAGPAPVAGFDPGTVANAVFREALVRVAAVVKPKAAAAVATTFSFPLILMLAVLLFLLGQHVLDARDPKMRATPRSADDAVLEFQDEERL
jgi:hypothetical protein